MSCVFSPILFRSIYVKNGKNKNILCIVGIYVDDILIAGKENEIKCIKEFFNRKYKIKKIGDVDFVIGIKFVKHKNRYLCIKEDTL